MCPLKVDGGGGGGWLMVDKDKGEYLVANFAALLPSASFCGPFLSRTTRSGEKGKGECNYIWIFWHCTMLVMIRTTSNTKILLSKLIFAKPICKDIALLDGKFYFLQSLTLFINVLMVIFMGFLSEP